MSATKTKPAPTSTGVKILANRKGLLAAFSAVSGVAPTRSPKPILQSLKLTVDPDEGSVLMATDLEVGIRYRVLGIQVDRPGSVILPTAKMQQILSTSSDEELSIECDGDSIQVRGARSRFTLPTEDPSLFPEVPDFTAAAYHVVGAADLGLLIRRTMFATDVESTRYALGGVLVELAGESIAMVGTDGRRLAKMSARAEAENDAPPPAGSPVIPVKALKLIGRNIDDDDPPVHLAFVSKDGAAPTGILVRTHNGVIYSRLVEGRFPRYQDVFPAAFKQRIDLDVAALKVAVAQATILTSDESRGVDFTFAAGSLTLASLAADVGSSSIETPIAHDGPSIVIAFDPRYLIDALKTIDDGRSFVVELVDDRNAAVFKTDDDFSYVVMPLTRER